MEITQQKGRRIPIHIQQAVETEVAKLVKNGHIEKLRKIGEDTFVSPVVITRKSDGSVKIALDSVQLNRQIVKKTMQMPLLSELLDQVSMKISGNRTAKLNVSTVDLEYAFGQIDLHPDTSRHCVAAIVGGTATGHYRFKKGFYGLPDMPVVFQTKIDQVLNNLTPAWQDDVIVVTRGTDVEHEAELFAVLKQLEDHGYKASAKNSKFFQSQTEWCGYLIDENGIRPKHSRTEAVQKINVPTTVKEVRSFLGSVQYLARFINNLSSKTEPIRQLLKKQVKRNWGPAQQSAFEEIKKDIADIATLKHYDPNKIYSSWSVESKGN